jgi:hypothetical protein
MSQIRVRFFSIKSWSISFKFFTIWFCYPKDIGEGLKKNFRLFLEKKAVFKKINPNFWVLLIKRVSCWFFARNMDLFACFFCTLLIYFLKLHLKMYLSFYVSSSYHMQYEFFVFFSRLLFNPKIIFLFSFDRWKFVGWSVSLWLFFWIRIFILLVFSNPARQSCVFLIVYGYHLVKPKL